MMTTNKLKNRLFGAAVLTAAGVLAAANGFAQPGPGPGPGHDRMARAVHQAMSILDLTDAQKAKVKTIFAAQRSENAAFRAQVEADRAALKAAAAAVNPDPAAVGAAFLKVRADGQAFGAKMKAVRGQVDAILTPEQKAKLDGWIAAHRQQRGGMFRRGGPPQD
jgi:Spy/CpxP family protein refolding chaperone